MCVCVYLDLYAITCECVRVCVCVCLGEILLIEETFEYLFWPKNYVYVCARIFFQNVSVWMRKCIYV